MSDDSSEAPEEEIPQDLVPGALPEEYEFPDLRRRAYGGFLVLAGGLLALAAAFRLEGQYVNGGWLTAAVLGILVGLYILSCSWKLKVSEKEAILKAAEELSFPIGPASISIGWRGLRSRPVWRVLAYSPETPRPARRGFVAIDAVSGEVIDKIDEKNPEGDWEEAAELTGP